MSVFAQHIAQAKQLEAASQPGRAEAILRDCLKRAPADVEVCRALGGLLMRWGHAGKGAVYLVRAVNASPQRPELWYELGACCATAGQFNDAAAALERGLAVAPRQAAFHELLGQVLCHLERFEQASEVIARGLELEPMNALLAQGYVIALKSCGRAGEAARQAERFAGLHADNGEALWLAAWQATYWEGGEPRKIREWMERRGRLQWNGVGTRAFENTPDPERRLHVGFLCQDIRRDSPIARFVDAPLMGLDRGAFEVHGYLTQPPLAHMSKRLVDATEQRGWLDVSKLSDPALAERIRADRIDVLVETAGNTAGNRQGALALGAAPVQVTCIGDPRTTGNAAIGWRVVDSVTDPDGAERYCTEKLARLAGCFLCYSPHEDAPAARAPIGPDAARITFGSLNVYHKINDAVLDAWAQILGQIEGSQLLVKSLGLRAVDVREYFYTALEARGVSRQRVMLEGEVESMRDHLAYLHRVDIALDTYPYNGTTTTCDALWMGVPVVTIEGSWHAARVGASLLKCVGLDELVADGVDAYVRIAAGLAGDRARLGELHRTLRERMAGSALCDAGGYAARLGEAYRGMWREWCGARR